jgi:hypothetical protein
MRQIVMRPGVAFSTAKVLREVLQVPGPAGVNVEEMRERLRLLRLVDEASGEKVLELEDGDYEQLVQLIRNFRFGMVTKDLIEIVDGILEPPPVRPRLAS